ncbi:hypothetical protein STEG23_011854 [Scotinomys teguina]
MQIKLPKRLGELKPQTVLQLSVVSEPPLCLNEIVPEYDPEEIKSYSDLAAQESQNYGGSCLMDKSSFQRSSDSCTPGEPENAFLHTLERQQPLFSSSLFHTHTWLTLVFSSKNTLPEDAVSTATLSEGFWSIS